MRRTGGSTATSTTRAASRSTLYGTSGTTTCTCRAIVRSTNANAMPGVTAKGTGTTEPVLCRIDRDRNTDRSSSGRRATRSRNRALAGEGAPSYAAGKAATENVSGSCPAVLEVEVLQPLEVG